MAYKKWVVASTDKEAANRLAEECDIDPFCALIAASRGYSDPADLEQFLSSEVVFSSPLETAGMAEAANALRKAIECDKKICVYGDYDCDGITATALLYSFLKEKVSNVIYYVPNRFDDGYGMNISVIDQLKAKEIELIVTVDNGIACVKEVEYAKNIGIETIITDHHLPPEIIPDAIAVTDPFLSKQKEVLEISGVCVAFKLICATEQKEPDELIDRYADLVSIGLIADIMPLVNENRDIVKRGILSINNTQRKGIQALLANAGVSKGMVTASRIAFTICPRINAAGRMANADIAIRLLLTEDFQEALELSSKLEDLNALRQRTEQEITTECIKIIEENKYNYERVIVVEGDNWHKGVVGIVAARITEKYGKPSVVLSVDENNEASGSGRSIVGFSLYNAVASQKEKLIRFGGHEGAAGLTLKAENIADFRSGINDYAASVSTAIPELLLDCKLNPAGISVDLADAIKQLEPFGTGNPNPIFGIFGLCLERLSGLSQNKHTKLLLSKNGCKLEALAFGVSPLAVPFSENDIIDIAVQIDTNEYMGKRSVSVIIKNWRMSGTDDAELFSDIELYEKLKRKEKADYPEITRDDVIAVYRTISLGPLSVETIKQKHINTLGYFRTAIALEALEELGVIKQIITEGVHKYILTNSGKVNLADSLILKEVTQYGCKL